MVMWLNKTLIEGDHLAICFTEEEYNKELKRLKVPSTEHGNWLSEGALATTHYLVSKKNIRATIVCIPIKDEPINTVACLLVHEAVHVVQEYFRYIGETNAGDEIQAYAIQNVSYVLLEAYCKRRFPKPKRENNNGLDMGLGNVPQCIHVQ
jgi:hypothetical protein